MNEEIIKTEWCIDKRVEQYTDSPENYSIPNEIMVTITLREYRRLLTAEANARAKEAESNKFAMEKKIKTLGEELAKVNNQLDVLLKCKGGEET